MRIFKVLEPSGVAQLNNIIDRLQWEDGRNTAVGKAKDIKDSFQIMPHTKGFEEIQPFIQAAHQVPVVRNWTFVKEILNPRVASYSDGGHYDWHTDSALMAGRRADLSFSIFLRDPSSYEGGEMNIELQPNVKTQVKCNAGEMVVYPSALLHKVNPVINGERRVIVGWLESNVKNQAHRNLLTKFNSELSRIKTSHPTSDFVNFGQIYQELLREFS